MADLQEIIAIQQLIARFANSFDVKDWSALEECLADELDTDYSDLRGTPAETISREKFVELRRAALHELQTHHLAGNVEIKLKQDEAQARVSMVIYRRAESGEVFNTHCLYLLGLGRITGSAVLNHILRVAKKRGYARVSLETGSQTEFNPARKLYEAFGFTYCSPFGDYIEDPNSVFMTKLL